MFIIIKILSHQYKHYNLEKMNEKNSNKHAAVFDDAGILFKKIEEHSAEAVQENTADTQVDMQEAAEPNTLPVQE